MRNEFLGYHKPKKNELERMWKECIFVFDTNVLLNFYRYTPETREDYFKILEQLKDRIWLPYQVAFEYYEERENVIHQQNSIYYDIENMNNLFQEKIVSKYKKGHAFADTDQLKNIFKEAVEKAKAVLQEAQAKQPNLLEEDTHVDRLNAIFEGKVGQSYSRDRLNKIYEEAQKRYKDYIPPGYKDEKSKEGLKPYGDVVLWYQLIDHAKTVKKPIILITDDAKEDWWRHDKKGKILGPRPELIQEIHDKANIPFYMYLADEFIKPAQEFLNVQVQQETIVEVREVRRQDEANQTNTRVYIGKPRRFDTTISPQQWQQAVETLNKISSSSFFNQNVLNAYHAQRMINSLLREDKQIENTLDIPSEEDIIIENSHSTEESDQEPNQDQDD